MPASKKRVQRGAGPPPSQTVPQALRDWVSIWHGVRVQTDSLGSAIFHAGSRYEALSYWKQFLRPPSKSLFPNIETRANPRKKYKDFLYVLLNLRWPMLMSVLLLVFVVNILAFAWLSWFACGFPADFFESFDLSYQTFTTIGFGIVYPKRTCSNMITTVESFASMLVTSAITGLVFAKFARPIAKVAFSKVCVVQPYGKKYLALVVRVANATQSRDVTRDVIMEASFKLNLLRVEQKNKRSATDILISTSCFPGENDVHAPPASNATTAPSSSATIRTESQKPPFLPQATSGDSTYSNPSMTSTSNRDDHQMLCSYNLKLAQNNFITFRMGVAIVHVIDEQSPLYGMTEYDIARSDMILEVSMTGVDSTLQDTVTERFHYTAQDIQWGYRFTELLEFHERNAEVIMNFAKLSATERAFINSDHYVHPEARYATDIQLPTDLVNNMAPDASRLSELDSEGECDELLSEPTTRLNRQSSDFSVASNSSAVGKKKKTGPKCSFAMEPLFEPLLQAPMGTQRLGPRNDPLQGRQRLHSGSTSDATDEVILHGRQKKRLQDQLVGELFVDDDNEDTNSGSTVLNDDDRFHPRDTNQSMVSIDVEDTPRFLRISPIHIPKSFDFMRLYHKALHERWSKIILVFVLAFLGINLAFALLFYADVDSIIPYDDVSVTKFELAFYMSVHTLATIGYGSIAPVPSSVYINFWVLVESALGIIVVTIITGIAWSKFARPRAHIHFSRKVILSKIYGHRCLVFRAANTRHSGEVHENFFRIGVILTNRKTGLRQMYDVPLVTAEWPSIKLPATLIHIIDESSPFYRFNSMADLSASRVSLIALLTGLDTTFSENVYARKMYFWDDFAYDMHFADFAVIKRDRVIVDFKRFDKLIPESYEPPAPETPPPLYAETTSC